MYKVLIADDEPMILNGLKYIIPWEEHGMEIVGEARNGQEALDIINQEDINIIITDIRMPVMDGLGLITRAKELSKAIQFIVLSGYDEFNYVKEALALGVQNYLLKPLNKQELSYTLSCAIEKIDSDMLRIANEQKSLDILRQNILYRWVTNSIEPKELLDRASIIGVNIDYKRYLVCTIKVLRDPSEDLVSFDGNIVPAGFGVQDICTSIMAEADAGIAFLDFNGDVVLIFSDDGSLSVESIHEVLKDCTHTIKERLKINVFVTVGDFQNSHTAVHKSYQNAVALQKYVLVLPPNTIVDFKQTQNGHSECEPDFNSELLKNLISTGKKEETVQYINMLFDTMKATEGITPSHIYMTTVEILSVINLCLRKLGSRTNPILADFHEIFSGMIEMKNLDELKNRILAIVTHTVELLGIHEGQATPVIKDAISYINSHYAKDISLKELSYHFNINPAYLGQQFKKETSVLFTDYINNLRVKKAIELLTGSSLKTSEICEKVGYRDVNYFYRIFKKITGVSPTEYRNGKI